MIKLILDTNILLVYLIGCYRPELTSRNSRTSSYDKEDFYSIEKYIEGKCLVITPYILAEISNLSLYIKEPGLTEY